MDDVEQSFDPAVGVVIDGLHLGTATGSLMSLWDVEQVEMLRGPQGTLFGKTPSRGPEHVAPGQPVSSAERVAMTIGEWIGVMSKASSTSRECSMTRFQRNLASLG